MDFGSSEFEVAQLSMNVELTGTAVMTVWGKSRWGWLRFLAEHGAVCKTTWVIESYYIETAISRSGQTGTHIVVESVALVIIFKAHFDTSNDLQTVFGVPMWLVAQECMNAEECTARDCVAWIWRYDKSTCLAFSWWYFHANASKARICTSVSSGPAPKGHTLKILRTDLVAVCHTPAEVKNLRGQVSEIR